MLSIIENESSESLPPLKWHKLKSSYGTALQSQAPSANYYASEPNDLRRQKFVFKWAVFLCFVLQIIINSWFSAPPTARTMTHYTVPFNSAIPEL